MLLYNLILSYFSFSTPGISILIELADIVVYFVIKSTIHNH